LDARLRGKAKNSLSKIVLYEKFISTYYYLTQIIFLKFNFHELSLYILLLYGILD